MTKRSATARGTCAKFISIRRSSRDTPNARIIRAAEIHAEAAMQNRSSMLAFLVVVTLLPTQAHAQGRGRAPVNLPEGPGKDIVQTVCAQCHGLGTIANDGYSRAEWPKIFGTMVEL